MLLPALYASHEPADTLRRNSSPETAAEKISAAAAVAFALRAEDERKKEKNGGQMEKKTRRGKNLSQDKTDESRSFGLILNVPLESGR